MDKGKMKDTIIITAIGSFSADIAIKSLKSIYRIIGTDSNDKEYLANAQEVDFFYRVSNADTSLFVDELKNICISNDVKIILPLTDPEIDVLNENREWFINNNIELIMSPFETIKLARNKKRLEDCISNIFNLEVIKPIKTISYYEGITVPFNYPFVVKPINGRSSIGLHYVKSLVEWDALAKKIDEKYIVQEYIEGDIISVDVICNPKKSQYVAIARKEVIRTNNGAGVSVKVFRDYELEKESIRIAKEIGAIGCINFEFIRNNEAAYFIESNPRLSGGISFSCATGYDCIINGLKCFKGDSIDSFNFNKTIYIARKYIDYITKIV